MASYDPDDRTSTESGQEGNDLSATAADGGKAKNVTDTDADTGANADTDADAAANGDTENDDGATAEERGEHDAEDAAENREPDPERADYEERSRRGHPLGAIAIMGGLFLLTQLFAFQLAPLFYSQGYQAFEDAESVWNPLWYIGVILLFTGVILLIVKLGRERVIKFVILGAFAMVMVYVFSAVLTPVLAPPIDPWETTPLAFSPVAVAVAVDDSDADNAAAFAFIDRGGTLHLHAPLGTEVAAPVSIENGTATRFLPPTATNATAFTVVVNRSQGMALAELSIDGAVRTRWSYTGEIVATPAIHAEGYRFALQTPNGSLALVTATAYETIWIEAGGVLAANTTSIAIATPHPATGEGDTAASTAAQPLIVVTTTAGKLRTVVATPGDLPADNWSLQHRASGDTINRYACGLTDAFSDRTPELFVLENNRNASAENGTDLSTNLTFYMLPSLEPVAELELAGHFVDAGSIDLFGDETEELFILTDARFTVIYAGDGAKNGVATYHYLREPETELASATALAVSTPAPGDGRARIAITTPARVHHAELNYRPGPLVTLPLIVGIGLAAALTLALVLYPEWYVIDAAGIVVAAGSTAIFGISVSILPCFVLLGVLAIYDAVAVYKTKHMVTLADSVVEQRLPILIVIPKRLSYSFRSQARLKEELERDEERDAIFMGLGDIVIPTVLAISAFTFLPASPSTFGLGANLLVAIGTVAGILGGYSVLMRYVLRGNPQAGLPLLNGGAVVGYLISYFLLYQELSFGIASPF